MQYINSSDFKLNNTLVTLGKFDGLHMGHQLIIETLIENKKPGDKVAVFTFDKAPGLITKPESGAEAGQLFTNEEKQLFAEKMGVDVLISYPFDKDFALMQPEDFVREILVKKVGARLVVCGSDFCFGRDRKGSAELLKELSGKYGFNVIVLEKKECELGSGKVVISSSLIRDELACGRVSNVNNLLGYDYRIISLVRRGKHLGTGLGFPTMNIEPAPEKLVPSDGVYATIAEVDNKKYVSVTNVGTKGKIFGDAPSASDNKIIETFIIDENIPKDFNAYDKVVSVMFIEHIREEMKFDLADEIMAQVDKDINDAKVILMQKKH